MGIVRTWLFIPVIEKAMKFIPTNIPDVILIEPKVFGDERGFFMETYQAQEFATAGLTLPFVQDNHSASQQGTLRGLHFQIHQAQGKLVRVIASEVFDVAVDLRRKSPSFGKWAGLRLSAENKLQLWIPPGFAHGFYVLSPRAEVVYKATDYYAPEWERTLLWNDPELAILWPLIDNRLLLSPKDANGKRFREIEVYE
jgi:dTDP-4-dehydrorhamnose 3,5-epimerase